MKKSEIVIGERYMTRVSGTLVEAIATGWLEKDGKFRRRDLVRVKRADNGKVLQSRDPSALHARLVTRETRQREREDRATMEPVQPFEQASGMLPMVYMQGRGAS